MSDGKKYYCFCGSNCKYETMTKEQILAAITQAVENGAVSDVDTGFVTKVKELNRGSFVSFWVGTKAQYNALEQHAENCFYVITDDTTQDDLRAAVDSILEKLEVMENCADYIVVGAANDDDGYIVRKYKSGFAEADFSIRLDNLKINKSYGGDFYWSGLAGTGMPFPIALDTDAHTCSLTIRSAEKANGETAPAMWIVATGKPTKDKTQAFGIVSNEQVEGVSVGINVHATWGWK